MSYKYALTGQEERALRELKLRLKRAFGDNFIGLKLFGSRARRDLHEESDIDILALFIDRTPEVEDGIAEILCDILSEFDVYFEVVSYGRDEYEKARERQWPFIINVEKEAIAV